MLLVRSLKVGDNAQVVKLKEKGKETVAVAVGTATGFRHPLFALWVDPEAKNGKHDWVGWTTSGPYDANAETAEARIGWLTATGDPARPVNFAGANQYRKLFYKRDILRLLLETADYNTAISRIPQPRRPTIAATIPGVAELRDGRLVTREKIDALEVTLSDPDNVLDLDRAELRWQITGPAWASEWKRESLAAARVVLDLSKHDWKRGEHRIQVKLFKTADAPDSAVVDSIPIAFWFMPPPPTLTVQLDGKPIAPQRGDYVREQRSRSDRDCGRESQPRGRAVTLSWTGGKPVELKRNPKVRSTKEGAAQRARHDRHSGYGNQPR